MTVVTQTAAKSVTKQRSGLQREVLSLYRLVLREAKQKDHELLQQSSATTNGTNTTLHYAKEEFRRQANQIPRSDFQRIEQQLRQGNKQLQLLRMPGVKVVRGVSS